MAQAIIETDLSGAHTPKSSKQGTVTPRTMTSPKCMCKSGCEVELKGSHVLEVVLEECVYCISITAWADSTVGNRKNKYQSQRLEKEIWLN